MNRLKLFFSVILITILLAVSLAGCSGGNKEPEKTSPAAIESITSGTPVEVASASVGSGGGSIIVDKPDSPVDGMEIKVPAGAYEDKIDFAVSYSPVKSHILGNEVTSESPLITVENDGGYADDFIVVTVPINVPEDRFAMAFSLDEKTGNLEGIPAYSQSAKELTLLTKNPTVFTLFSIEKEKLLELNIDTKFKIGQDDWNLVNAGSCMEPGGYCRGMCLSSVWYYTREKPSIGETLWSRNDNGLGKGRETPNFWKDDTWAIRLCSAIQVNSTNMTSGLLYDVIQQKYHIDPARTPNRANFYCLAFSLYVSQKLHDEDPARPISPQVIGVYGKRVSDNATLGHAIVCYKLTGSTLHISDPNMPGQDPVIATITYDDRNGIEDGVFSKYASAQDALDFLSGNVFVYDKVRFRGVSSFDDVQEIDEFWTTAENGRCPSGTTKNCFPDYQLYLEVDNPDGTPNDVAIDPLQGITVNTDRIKVYPVSPFDKGRLDVYDYKDIEAHEKAKKATPDSTNIKFPTPIDLPNHTLKEGDNLLGFCLMAVTGTHKNSAGQTVSELSWAGFDWINVRYEPGKTPKASFDLSRITACSIRLENIEATMRQPDGKETAGTVSPTESNTGSCWGEGTFSGNVFTAIWTDRSCGSSCTATGTIKTTVDPETMEIISFSLSNDTNDKWQPDWVISMDSAPGIKIGTDLEDFEKYHPDKLTYRVSGSKAADYINGDTFVYKWTPGSDDQWRICTGFDGTGDTLLTITFAVGE